MNTDLFLIGVDGGGTGTRVVLADAHGREYACGSGGASGLGLGIEHAWESIKGACIHAFARADLALDWSRCVLGCGVAGANNRAWLAHFVAQAPVLAGLTVQSDAYTALIGAHDGAPGVIIALGTGSIAAALDIKGACRFSGGYGFPSGDEASGAWLGLRAIVHAQCALDGRAPFDTFARALLAQTDTHDRDGLIGWLCTANQTAYAALAPIVFEHARHPVAARLLDDAGTAITAMIDSVDASATLPVALCGGLAEPMQAFLPQPYRARLVAPQADSAHGALKLAQRLVAQRYNIRPTTY